MKEHITELHFLKMETRLKFLKEMSIVGEAVYQAFLPDKLNYELLGNGDAHLHWHIFPRRDGDFEKKGPVWWLDREIMFSDEVILESEELEKMIQLLRAELSKVIQKT